MDEIANILMPKTPTAQENTQVASTKKKVEKKHHDTFADSEFDDCLDRDIESQISELNLEELGLT